MGCLSCHPVHWGLHHTPTGPLHKLHLSQWQGGGLFGYNSPGHPPQQLFPRVTPHSQHLTLCRGFSESMGTVHICSPSDEVLYIITWEGTNGISSLKKVLLWMFCIIYHILELTKAQNMFTCSERTVRLSWVTKALVLPLKWWQGCVLKRQNLFSVWFLQLTRIPGLMY